MAEIVGLVASIVALAETGFKISKTISRIAAEFGTAGAQIKAIGTDTRAVSLVLHELQKRLKRMQHVAAEVRNVVTDIVALCKTDIDEIAGFINCLEPQDGSDVTVKQKTKWLFTKSKVSLRRASLDSLKLTLSLFVHTLEFIESGEVDEHIKDEVDTLIEETKNTKKELLNGEHADQKEEEAYYARERPVIKERMRIRSGETLGQDEGQVALTGTIAAMEFDVYEVEDVDSDQNRQLQLYDPERNLGVMRTMSDDHLILIADHIRLQKLVTNFALAIMDSEAGFLSNESPPMPGQVPSPSSSTHRRLGVDDYLKPEGTTTKNALGNQGSNLQDINRSSGDISSPDRSRSSAATPSRGKSIESRIDMNTMLGSSMKKVAFPEDVGIQPDASSDLRDFETAQLTKESPEERSRELIRFKFDIPSEEVWYPMPYFSTVEDLHETIMEIAYQATLSELDLELLGNKEYILLDTGNQVLLPKFWRDTVKPGSSIILRLNSSIGITWRKYSRDYVKPAEVWERETSLLRIRDAAKFSRQGTLSTNNAQKGSKSFKEYLRNFQKR